MKPVAKLKYRYKIQKQNTDTNTKYTKRNTKGEKKN